MTFELRLVGRTVLAHSRWRRGSAHDLLRSRFTALARIGPPTCLCIMLAAFSSAGASGRPGSPALVSANAAVASRHRPEADRARDGQRKPAYLVSLARLSRGGKVADIIPGSGYFTRIFSDVVGPRGVVYGVIPSELLAENPKVDGQLRTVTDDPAFGNVRRLVSPASSLTTPERVDLAWTSDNYHDLHANLSPDALASFDSSVFAMVRPGGRFIVIDYVGDAQASGKPALHRVAPSAVRAEVEAAGFEFEAESTILFNPDDDHQSPIFDPKVKGHADQFVYVFRKPVSIVKRRTRASVRGASGTAS